MPVPVRTAPIDSSLTACGRHRGRHRDPVGAALAGLWALGNAAVITLLGASVHNQLDHRTGPHGMAPASSSDVEPYS
ncbi:hypothetical protein KSE_23760 [Kitasatospora setae KM-6054]|uniref:Uncharacterized protein n=1 Tax=Kitasatospora setae (strain ATCC 33774 / DSM 43861 / JCM 3304 / KCC A-0304 / NBRC 14216 / KM-6054) TaxID=452652 RepID=E4NAG3_KITSK|nr:hypothetical protein KSE_23760 [Kitasatospora setae KM-6054]